jgi:hypothetical protein
MYDDAHVVRQLSAITIIEPCRNEILTCHVPTYESFGEIVYDNPFIPVGREPIFQRGLFEGLRGDFLVATHLLMPQVEDSLRELLRKNGKIASKISNDGLQEDMSLGDLLSDSVAEKGKNALTEILGEDTVFDLRSLLIEKSSINLRNEIAHGKVEASTFEGRTVEYFWWLIFRICLLCKHTRTDAP